MYANEGGGLYNVYIYACALKLLSLYNTDTNAANVWIVETYTTCTIFRVCVYRFRMHYAVY